MISSRHRNWQLKISGLGALGRITGEIDVEELLGSIFQPFVLENKQKTGITEQS